MYSVFYFTVDFIFLYFLPDTLFILVSTYFTFYFLNIFFVETQR